jgi:hypothetical protein
MKQTWEVQRSGVQQLDAQRRWDIAYRRLWQWTNEITVVPDEGTVTLITEEVKDENSLLCSCLDLTAATEPNH